MAHGSPVPELYKSIIEDVIEGVRELFAEEGIEDQVLKDLKQLWETKVTQSKATEGFFRHSHCSPRFSLQLPRSSHSILQTSAASFVIQAGRGFQHFTAAKLGPPRVGVTLAVPSCVAYPLQMPGGVMLQPAPGQLYKVNVPVVVTQASGDGSILHYPVQQMFHPLGQASVLQASLASVTQVNASAAHAAGEALQPQETAVQQAVLFKPSCVEKQHLENSATLVQKPSVSQHEFEINAALNQCSESTEKFQHDNLHTAVFTPECSEGLFIEESLASSSSSVLLDVEGQLDMEHPELLQPQVSDDIIDLIIAGESLDENAFLKGQGSVASSNKDPLNSGDDVSEQDLADLFDTENVIVCQYEKIHRTKNKWKFYLKDGVMSIDGKDHVFAKATGDAEW
ncbi:TFIIA-alpha and beta-like factor isoform X4 [Hirundo rustica]|uniref:TFIIA-alpha and beta-like factor isoform X4 n=1 Tax=Hirundo rustica TaxID=43150 RepID=UPI001A94A57D|nr:TFIIA-alpha and beta-like factor isoform X4 [Hirundo rustica]